MKYPGLKFMIENEEQSKIVQRLLFDMGYGWCSTRAPKDIKITNQKYLYATQRGSILHGNEASTFYETYEDLKEIDVSWIVLPERKKVLIGTEVYYDDEIQTIIQSTGTKPVQVEK